MAKYKLGLGQFFDKRQRLHKEGDEFTLPNGEKPPRYAIPVDADARKTVRAIIKETFLEPITGGPRKMDEGEKARREYEDLCRRYWLRSTSRTDNEEDPEDDEELVAGDTEGDEGEDEDEAPADSGDEMTMQQARGHLDGAAGAGAPRPKAKKAARAADKGV